MRFAAGVVAVFACWASNAASATGAVRGPTARTFLQWEAPDGCSSSQAVYERAQAAVGFPPEQGRIRHVRGVVVPVESEWLLTLEFVEEDGRHSRSIRAARCEDLEGAAAVALALALGNGVPPEPEPAAAEPKPPPQPPAARAGAGWSGTLSGLVDFASLQQPSWGLGADLGLRLDAWNFGVFGLWLPAVESGVRAGESVQFALLGAGPRVCRELLASPALSLCAGFELGSFRADGAGLSRDERHFSRRWLAPRLALALQQTLGGPWNLELRGEALRPLTRESYTVNQNETVYEPPELAVRFYLGLGVSIDAGVPSAVR